MRGGGMPPPCRLPGHRLGLDRSSSRASCRGWLRGLWPLSRGWQLHTLRGRGGGINTSPFKFEGGLPPVYNFPNSFNNTHP